MTRPRLVWNDSGALDRLAVQLACQGTTAELEAYLARRRGKYPLRVVPSGHGVAWRGSVDLAASVEAGPHDGLDD